MMKILLSHFGSWVVIGSGRGATIKSVAGLIAGVLDEFDSGLISQPAARGSVNKVAL
jgi:hypothetical protein